MSENWGFRAENCWEIFGFLMLVGIVLDSDVFLYDLKTWKINLLKN